MLDLALRTGIISDVLDQKQSDGAMHILNAASGNNPGMSAITAALPGLLEYRVNRSFEASRRGDPALRQELIRTLAVAFEWVEHLDREEIRNGTSH